MRCKRCHGLIVMERCADAEFSEGSAGVSAIRCINCGAREHGGLLRDRAASGSQTWELEENGLEAAKLSAEWYGHIRLIVSSEPHVNGQNNHRLEIILES
jgi:hypothetical protein